MCFVGAVNLGSISQRHKSGEESLVKIERVPVKDEVMDGHFLREINVHGTRLFLSSSSFVLLPSSQWQFPLQLSLADMSRFDLLEYE